MIYFGYGSNLSPVGLRAKGVEPVESLPGLLRGWRLEFSVTPPFPSQGAMATVVYTGDPADAVHGVLHDCDERAFGPIDAFEARGTFYERLQLPVETYAGTRAIAWIYVVLPAFHQPGLLPTKRYLTNIVMGAETMRLDVGYVSRLKATPALPPRTWPAFEHPALPNHSFDHQGLAIAERHVALAGAVFDMTDASYKTAFLVPMWSGRDVTLFMLKMLDPSLDEAMWSRIARDHLDGPQRNHLNGYLHEFAAAFRYAGRYVDDRRAEYK